MTELHVIRHVIRKHQPEPGEDYDPGSDMLIIVHKNPEDPDDPTEFGHHMRMQALPYQKEVLGLSEYSDVVDTELRDLERYYCRSEALEYGTHPLAGITRHYFEAPSQRMKGFNPHYVIDRTGIQSAAPQSVEGFQRMCADVVLSGIGDVRKCLSSADKQAFPCRQMTGLSTDTRAKRTETLDRLGEQTQQITPVPSAALDDLCQYLTDRASELDKVQDGFVNGALMQAHVPEIMRQRVVRATVERGIAPAALAELSL